MASISSYVKDAQVTEKDKLLGSSYEGEGLSGPIYETKNFTIGSLVSYLNRVFTVDEVNYNLNDLVNSVASANQSITLVANDVLAQATFQTNLSATFGTFTDQGVLISLSQAFADQVLQTTASDRYANALFVTNLASSVGTFDANGNLLTIAQGFANSVMTTTSSDRFAESQFVDKLGASFGTVGPDGTITTFSSEYLNTITTYVDENSATAEALSNLETQVNNIPTTIRQPEEPDVNAYPLGSIWVDTDDDNSLYILLEGTPNFWQPTTSEALGDLIQSTAQLQQTVNLLSTSQNALATKTTTLTAQFGTYDPVTDTFTFSSDATYFEQVKNYADVDSATAQKTESLGATFGAFDAETNTFSVSDASMKTIVDALALDNYASTSRVNGVEATVGNIPLIFKQDDQPSVDSPVGSLWFETDNDNKRYILTAGPPKAWEVLEDGEFQAFKSSATDSIDTNASDISAEATRITNLNSVLEILDANGNLQVASKADYFDEITTYVDSNSAVAGRVTTLEATVGDENSGLVASVETNESAIVNVNGNLDAQYGLKVTAGGAVAGMKLSASASDDNVATSEIAFNADIFKIFTGSEQTPASQAPFLLNQSGLFLNVPLNGVSGSFSGDISAATGTFGGSLNVNDNFLVSSSGSVQILGGDTLGESRFEILDDNNNSKFRLYGGGINMNSWTGTGALSGGQIQFGGVAHMYSGNGTTTTSNHHMTLDVYGGSQKLFLKADEITLRRSGDAGSHKTIIEGDLEVQGDVSFTSSSSHPDTSSVTNSSNTGQTFIQNLNFDEYGHVTSFTNATISTETPAIYADGSGNPQLTTGVTAAEVRNLIGATTFSGSYDDLSNKPSFGTAAFANTGDFATAGHNHTYNVNDAWFRDNDDNAHVKLYGNSRQMVFRTDGTTEYASSIGGYPFVWMYGGDSASNRRMMLNESGQLWLSNYGWLHEAFASAGHLHDSRYLRKDVSDTMDGTFTATGDVIAYGTSDRNLKDNIKPIENPIDKIKSIGGYEFDWNEKQDVYKGHDVGVIAQEIESIMPEVVSTRKNGYKAVKYDRIVPLLIEAIKEQQKQIEELKSIIDGGTN